MGTVANPLHDNAKLTASDGANGDYFGNTLSLSGTMGLVGAYQAKVGANAGQGAAYLFRNLDTVAGNVSQSVKLTASDGSVGRGFGRSVALAGNIALVGVNVQNAFAYLFRNLDTAVGTVANPLHENAKLIGTDSNLGSSGGISISGSTALVGSYYFRNLDTATGTITETLKFSNGTRPSLDGDRFILGTNSFSGTIRIPATLPYPMFSASGRRKTG